MLWGGYHDFSWNEHQNCFVGSFEDVAVSSKLHSGIILTATGGCGHDNSSMLEGASL